MSNVEVGPRGRFIVIDGPEGAGKTTICRRLAEDFPEDIVPIREPGGTMIGEEIRRLLLDPASQILPLTEFLLFWAARSQFLIEKVAPLLSQGKHVVADRYAPSTYAYQISGRQMRDEVALFHTLERGMEKHASPDLYIFLDIVPELGMERALKRSQADRMEQEKMSFHRRVYEGYHEFFSTRPHRRVDATKSEDEVYAEVRSAIVNLIAIDVMQKA
jgi:dTMP kinase